MPAEQRTTCEQCGDALPLGRPTSNPRRFCSNRCQLASRYQPKPPKATRCQVCETALPEPRDPRTLYCSDYCSQKANRTRNSEAIRAGKRRYREANIERIRAKDAARTTEQRRPAAAAYYLKNRDAVNAYKRSRRERDRILERERYARDSASKKAAVQRWMQANPEQAAEIRRRRRARQAAAPTVPFTTEQLEQRLAYFGHRCWMCGKPGNQIDHVKPLAAGGWHALCNFRPICSSCNPSKKDSWPIDTRWSLRRIA